MQVLYMIKDIYLTKTRDEWIELFMANEIPVAPVQSVDDFMQEPQVIANDMIKTIQQPGVGMVKEMGLPVEFLGTPGKIKGPAPLPGQHTKDILKTLGYNAAQIKDLKKAGAIR
jgi:crotonobetainyl-CoA:carnitine CoA-transferase CaiB-like acyl-CoA transferase